MPSKTFSVDFETSGFRKASRQMSKVGDEADDSGSSLQTAGKVGAAAIGAITTAVTGAVAGLAKLTSNATDYARQVDEAASQSGIAAERIQEIAFAAEQTSGADFDTVRDGLKELAIRSEEAANGTGEAKEAFDELGISQQFLEDASTAEIFQRVRQELQGASARMRTFAAETIFGGEAGQRLTEVLGLSEEQMQSMAQQARETGSVMSGEQVQALEQTRMAWSRIWATLRGLGRSIAASLLPVIQRLTPIVQRAASSLQRMFSGLDQQAVGSVFNSAIAGANRFWSVTSTVADAVTDIWNGFVSGISKVWQQWGTFIVEQAQSAWENVVSVLRGAFGVVAGLWETLIGTLTGNWSRAWSGIKQVMTSAVLTISQAIVGLVESVLNTLAELTSHIPGVGETISGGLETARASVENFRESIQEANKEASGLQSVWEGFSGGDFGGAGAGGPFSVSSGGPDTPGQASAPSGESEGGGESQGGALMHWVRQIDKIQRKTQNAKEQTTSLQRAGQTAASVVGRGFNRVGRSIGRAVTNLIAGTQAARSFGKTMVSALKGILSQLVALIPKLAIIKGIGAIAGISTGGISSIGGALTQAIPFLDTGGKILSDGIAKVHAGETVVPEGAMPQGSPAGGTLEARISLDELIFRLEQRRAHNAA